ncbi:MULTISPECIES: molecular chaperone TorD [Citrobacter]|uniref:Chaperone protein TorD n=1 Tax=Citrobacter europaeus TaxID=1914243 RepID=A0ABY0JSJ4_9ENTR|nr:molecular chaperone TorD [Citrobacter europaeus]ARC39249.1 molecular chaperone TorD [Citrobacter braakii]ATX03815.1 molecular chaperone TorD [Citrobacter freundii]MCB6778020.1 molecular chaperone TorD [Citrobacter sp. 210820-DFI.7.8]MCB6787720.1 molecular chaperone TorD [Citrobacter sp. 210820-DFI.7.7]MBJ8823157.1 molecular chaperone TorD [Citrobacter freundii]
MQHNQIHQQRTAIYQWFSQLLFRELDEKQLASLENGDNRAWIASLAAIPGLSVEVKHFVRSLERVLRRDSRQLELAADFASLFMLSPPASVSPYAGHYPHTTAAAERRQMNVLLVEQGLAARENESSDHIAVQLALMARMVAKEEKLSTQYYFLHHHIMCWASLLRDSCLARDEEGFYPQAVNLVVRFMREDEQYLESLLMDDFYLSSQR